MQCSVALSFLLLFVIQVEGCGISTHIEIGHMAATIFHDHHSISYRELILKHQDAFQAGNTYPDTYYSSACYNGKYHSVSEDTHWTAFTNVTLQYIRKNFPPPWTVETEKFVVFMLGYVSHQVADISWHSLGISQGFIRAMAAVDFHGIYSTAHSAADLGGDVINEFRGDYSYVNYDQWYLPVNHLTNIYSMYYGGPGTMTSEVIEDCMSLIFLAVLGEKIALSELYPTTAVQSPFLTQNLDLYFLGGMYDMALWTTSIWENVIYILENGFSERCSTPDNPLYIRCNKRNNSPFTNKDGSLLSVTKDMTSRVPLTEPASQLYMRRLTRSSIKVERTEYGVILRPTQAVKEELRAQQKKLSLKAKHRNPETSTAQSPKTIISTSAPYSRLGHVLLFADLNNDNISDLVISAPMYPHTINTDYKGAVFVIYGKVDGLPKGNFAVEDLADKAFYGDVPIAAGRFGSAVAVLDINLDGYADIVISSPNVDWNILQYIGQLTVYFGHKNGTFSDKQPLVHSFWPVSVYNNEAITLLAADADGDGHDDLIIGSPYALGPAGPQSGNICIMKSIKWFHFDIWKCIHGPGMEASMSWFGSSMLVTSIPNTGKVLIVAAPLLRKCILPSCEFHENDTQSVGQVTVWNFPDLKLLKQMSGSLEHEHFGSSLSVGHPYGSDETAVLAVGRDSVDVNGTIFGKPTVLHQAGGVALYNLSTLLTRDGSKSDAVLYGDRQFSMFGAATTFEDLDADGKDELIVGAPHFTDDATEYLYGAEQGLVYVFGGKDQDIPLNDVDNKTCAHSWISPCPATVSSQMFGWKENKAHLGGRVEVTKCTSNVSQSSNFSQVAVSALRSSHGARHSGAVLIF